MQNAKQIIAQKVMKTASKHQFRGGFCLLLPKKIQLGKPCGSMDSWFYATCVFVFLRFFKPFPNPHTDKSVCKQMRKKGRASAQPFVLLQSYDLLI